MRILEKCRWVDLYLRGRGGGGGSKPDYPEKPPDNQPENRYHIIIRGEHISPQLGIEPSPSNIGDKFAWSERPWYKRRKTAGLWYLYYYRTPGQRAHTKLTGCVWAQWPFFSNRTVLQFSLAATSL